MIYSLALCVTAGSCCMYCAIYIVYIEAESKKKICLQSSNISGSNIEVPKVQNSQKVYGGLVKIKMGQIWEYFTISIMVLLCNSSHETLIGH